MKETKTIRKELLVYPSTVSDARKLIEAGKFKSFNDFANQAMKNTIKGTQRATSGKIILNR